MSTSGTGSEADLRERGVNAFQSRFLYGIFYQRSTQDPVHAAIDGIERAGAGFGNRHRLTGDREIIRDHSQLGTVRNGFD